jgi:putative oxidoreductase
MNFTNNYRIWLLRFALASVFLFHGIGKLAGPGGVGGFAGMMSLPLVAAWLVTLAEVGGGLGILVGGLKASPAWLSRIGGLALIPVMLGAIAMVHWPRWSFVPTESHPMGGMEFQVVLLLLAVWFALGGGETE